MNLNEVAPPGWGHTKAEKEKTKPNKPKSKIGGTAAAFKRALDDGRFKGLPGSTTKKEKTADMFKLMYSMKKKGYKPHYKPGTDKKYKKYQEEQSNPRIPRKPGQPANSKKHSDLYTDENPKGTIHGLGFKDVATAKASVSKIRNSSRSHAHKIQAAVAMEQRAREMGKTSEAAVYRKFINTMKKKTKQMNESVQNNKVDLVLKTDVNNVLKQDNKDYDRGLLAKVNKDGSYDVAYWYDKYKAYPVEVEIDGKSVKKDAKNIHIKFHPELKKKNKEEAKKAMNEGSLHKWFKGSKSKDGKGGWVNVVTGGTCASDEPGEGTPKCVSSAKRASMTKAERLSAARRKKKADPGQQSKSGAAKPTYVSTDSPRKKKMKEETSMQDNNLFGNAFAYQRLKKKVGSKKKHDKPAMESVITMIGRRKKEKTASKAMDAGARARRSLQRRDYASAVSGSTDRVPKELEDQVQYEEKGLQKIAKELNKASKLHKGQSKALAKASKMHKGQSEKIKKHIGDMEEAMDMKLETKKNCGCGQDPCITYGTKKLTQAQKVKEAALDEKCWKGYEKKGMKTMFGKRYPNCVKKKATRKEEFSVEQKGYQPEIEHSKMGDAKKKADKKRESRLPPHLQGDAIGKMKKAFASTNEEAQLTETDKKGKGSGTKDACYHKVKSRYSVWPSAYASGALVKCRKVGAANWGNSSKKEEFEGWTSDPILEKVAAWQRKEGKNPEGGLNQKGVDSYRRENPGSKLKTAVTTKPSKLKKGSKAANRRKSFCARMGGMKKRLTSAKTANDPDSRINKALRKWNC